MNERGSSEGRTEGERERVEGRGRERAEVRANSLSLLPFCPVPVAPDQLGEERGRKRR